MNTAQYLAEIDKVWMEISNRVEDLGLDVDCYTIGSVFTVETLDKKQIIINRQEPKHELWLASTAGASHYIFEDGQWVNTVTKESFWQYLDQAFEAIGENKIFTDLY